MANGAYTDSFEELSTNLPSGYQLINNQKGLVSKKGSSTFTITLLTNYDRVLIEYFKQGGLYLSFSFNLDTAQAKRYCTSYGNYEGDKICKGLGTVGTWRDGCTGGTTCHHWELQ